MTVQEEFDKTYVTSTEICRRLGVDRSTLLSRERKGQLPNAILLSNGMIRIWKREEVEPYVAALVIAAKVRRRESLV